MSGEQVSNTPALVDVSHAPEDIPPSGLSEETLAAACEYAEEHIFEAGLLQ